ncbi:MAG TPA: PHP domain-containing protein [Dehalococcoidales bacterium]|nr:PHP domain-containing protein [Dehalococcoidales bacterium]
MSKVDLHLHTTASDGKHTPAELVRLAASRGLEFIAITDHDTIDGVAPALSEARKFPGLHVVPGVELSTDVPKGEVHLLGYFIDFEDEQFRAKLAEMRNSRVNRARKMVEKLGTMGMHVDWKRVQEIAGAGAMGRPHIAQAMLEKGYIRTTQDAFRNYIGHGGPAYVERDKLTPVEAVGLVLAAGGLPVLAHPFTSGDAEETIKELKTAGLVGVEAHYASYSIEQVNMLVGMAAKYSLIATGGTDYHGIDLTTETMVGGVDVPVQAVEELNNIAISRGLAKAFGRGF